MASAVPSPTPNPDATKYTLDVRLPAMVNVAAGAEAPEPWVAEILAVDGVASVFGVNDFVTVTRVPGADWDAITGAVQAAVGRHL